MIKFLIKKLIPDAENVTDRAVRERYGMLGGILGVICNLFLFAVKTAIGMLMNSIAIISDAFNNLSDLGSSLVTIIGTKMSNRHPDKEHPFGHGRIEYISSLIVSFIIILVGFELMKGSVEKILHPQEIAFQPILVAILTLSVLVKVWMFSYNRYMAKKIDSSVLNATAFDSLNDVYATGAVILATIAGQFTKLPVDGITGFIVSILVMVTGYKISKNTIGILLGTPPKPEVVNEINEIILGQEGIVGVHDLIIHDYGPGRVMASVHAEVPDTIDIVKIHEIIDETEKRILQDMGIHIVIHMDPITVNSQRLEDLKNSVIQTVKSVNAAFNIHDFRMTDGEKNINLIFDLEVPCAMKESERKKALEEINLQLKQQDNRYNAVISVDDAF